MEKDVLEKEMFTNGLNLDLPLQASTEETVHWLEILI